MTITLCGSMSAFAEMQQVAVQLRSTGWTVHLPDEEGTGTDYAAMSLEEQTQSKNVFIHKHIAHIKESDAILVVNPPKKGIAHYIGANSFLEMGFAFLLEKKIFLLFDVPEQENSVEIRGMLPVCLQGNINLIINEAPS